MSEQQTFEDHTAVNTASPRIQALRLINVARSDEMGLPARIVAHVDIHQGDTGQSRFAERSLPGESSTARISPVLWSMLENALQALHEVDVTDSDGVKAVIEAERQRITREFADYNRRLHQHSGSLYSRLWRKARRAARIAINRGRGIKTAEAIGVRQIKLAFDALIDALSGSDRAQHGDLEEFYAQNLSRVMRYSVAPEPEAPENHGQPANTFDDAPFIEPLPKDGTKGHLLEREALRYGFSSVRFPSGAFVVTSPSGDRLNFKWGRSPIASGVALSICSYKETTRRLLARAGIPVAAGRVFSPQDAEVALDYADRIGYPVVCKPVAGLRGIGVITDIRNREELNEALELYSKSELGNDDFVIEEQVPGEDYRIVIIDGEVVASVVRAPASVIGDGVHTVADLIEYKNRARKRNPHLSTRLIPFADAVEYQLAHSGLTYGSIPISGQKVTVANSANLTQGGDSFEITAEIHPSIKELAVKAVEAIPGLGFCGLDMLIEDHTKSVDEQRVTVIELNAHAAIGSAQYPMWGTPSEVAHTFFRATAAFHGIDLPAERTDALSLDLRIKGNVTGVGYRWWFKRQADKFGITGYVKNINKRTVCAHIEGQADAVSAMAYSASRGPRRSLVSSVTMEPVPFEGATTFEIRRPAATPRNIAKALLRR